MDYTVSCKTYLSKETTCALKKLLFKTKTIPEIQVNGKVYMERKDYRRLQKNAPAIPDMIIAHRNAIEIIPRAGC